MGTGVWCHPRGDTPYASTGGVREEGLAGEAVGPAGGILGADWLGSGGILATNWLESTVGDPSHRLGGGCCRVWGDPGC